MRVHEKVHCVVDLPLLAADHTLHIYRLLKYISEQLCLQLSRMTLYPDGPQLLMYALSLRVLLMYFITFKQCYYNTKLVSAILMLFLTYQIGLAGCMVLFCPHAY